MSALYVHLFFNPTLGNGLFPCLSLNAFLINTIPVDRCAHCYQENVEASLAIASSYDSLRAVMADGDCIFCRSCNTLFLSKEDMGAIRYAVVSGDPVHISKGPDHWRPPSLDQPFAS